MCVRDARFGLAASKGRNGRGMRITRVIMGIRGSMGSGDYMMKDGGRGREMLDSCAHTHTP